jgi:hypothetical protein
MHAATTNYTWKVDYFILQGLIQFCYTVIYAKSTTTTITTSERMSIPVITKETEHVELAS